MALNAGISYNVTPNYQHQCGWSLTVTDGENTHIVGYPLTIEFNIERNTFASANTATFNIYNLSPSTRSAKGGLFFQDRFNTSQNKILTFKAGYNGKLTTCFKGRIQEAYSRRQGTEVITSIQCLDLGIPTDYINVTFEAGTTKKEAYKNIIQNLGYLEQGAIGTLEGEYKTPVTFEGKPLDVLNQITGGNTFIDNGVINTLMPNECLDEGVPILKAETGLINTPQRRDAQIIAEGIFNPNAIVGQLMEVQSTTAREFSGTFQLCGISHSGTISGAQAGTRTTRYNFLVGAMLPNGSYTLTGTTEKQPFTKVKKEQKTVVNSSAGADVYSVYNHIRSHNGQPPNSKVGHTNFTWKQLLLPGGTNNTAQQIYSQITVSDLQNCKIIAEKLYDFLKVNFSGRTINIVSNWRSKQNNESYANASKESAHLRGAAIDFNINGLNTQIAFKTFNRLWDKFTYIYQPVDKYGHKKNYYMLHVQSTPGANGALRASGQKQQYA